MNLKEVIVDQPSSPGNHLELNLTPSKRREIPVVLFCELVNSSEVTDQYKTTYLKTDSEEVNLHEYVKQEETTNMPECQKNNNFSQRHSQGRLQPLENAEQIVSLTESKKVYNLPDSEQSRISSNSPTSKSNRHSSVAHINRLSVGHRNEVGDVNSQSLSEILDTTSSLVYPVVHLIRDQCTLCKCLFASNRLSMHHVRYVHVCNRAVNKYQLRHDRPTGSLDETIVTRRSMKSHSCRVCRERFHSKSELTKHLTSHTQDNTYSSDRGFNLSNWTDNFVTDVHTGTHSETPEKSFACSLCSHRYSAKGSLSRHMRSHTGEKPFSCTICFSRFSTSGSLSMHMLIHTGEKRFTCTLCYYRCNQRYQLSVHMRSHTGEKPFACSLCPYRCKSNDALSKHVDRHANDKPFACALCPYRCNVSSSIFRHMRSHTGEKPFACKSCSYRCSQSSHLSRHMLSHSGERKFACTICSFRCKVSENLSMHMRSHTAEKPFPCTLCTSRFSSSSYLSVHMRSHTGEKPFACTICAYRCSQRTHLSVHMRSHTGEKPFACTMCTLRFISGSHLSRHMRRHHW